MSVTSSSRMPITLRSSSGLPGCPCPRHNIHAHSRCPIKYPYKRASLSLAHSNTHTQKRTHWSLMVISRSSLLTHRTCSRRLCFHDIIVCVPPSDWMRTCTLRDAHWYCELVVQPTWTRPTTQHRYTEGKKRSPGARTERYHTPPLTHAKHANTWTLISHSTTNTNSLARRGHIEWMMTGRYGVGGGVIYERIRYVYYIYFGRIISFG